MPGKRKLNRIEVLVHPHCSNRGEHYDHVWRQSAEELAKDPEAWLVIFSKVWGSRDIDPALDSRKRALIRFAKKTMGKDRVIVTVSPERVKRMIEGRGIEISKDLDMTAYGMYEGHEILCVPSFGKATRDALGAKRFRIDKSRSVVRKINI